MVDDFPHLTPFRIWRAFGAHLPTLEQSQICAALHNVTMAASMVMNALTTTMPVAMTFKSVEVKDPRQRVPLSDTRLERVHKRKRLYRADAEEIRPGGQLYDRWLQTIKQQIHIDLQPARDEIKAQCNSKSSDETMFNYKLFMVGKADQGATDVLLGPRVWFFFGSKWCKRIVKKVLADLKWLQSWGIDGCEIEVGGPIFLAAGADDQTLDDELRNLNLDLGEGIELSNGYTAYLHVQIPRPSNFAVSAMGLLCCSTLAQNGTIVSRKLSRMGGMVEVWCENKSTDDNRTRLGVTTAHNLVDSWLDGEPYFST